MKIALARRHVLFFTTQQTNRFEDEDSPCRNCSLLSQHSKQTDLKMKTALRLADAVNLSTTQQTNSQICQNWDFGASAFSSRRFHPLTVTYTTQWQKTEAHSHSTEKEENRNKKTWNADILTPKWQPQTQYWRLISVGLNHKNGGTYWDQFGSVMELSMLTRGI